jgi:hypothetical protein
MKTSEKMEQICFVTVVPAADKVDLILRRRGRGT